MRVNGATNRSCGYRSQNDADCLQYGENAEHEKVYKSKIRELPSLRGRPPSYLYVPAWHETELSPMKSASFGPSMDQK